MRVLFLSVSADLGGAERVLLDAVTALHTLHPSWTLGVVSLAEGPLAGELAARGVEVLLRLVHPRLTRQMVAACPNSSFRSSVPSFPLTSPVRFATRPSCSVN